MKRRKQKQRNVIFVRPYRLRNATDRPSFDLPHRYYVHPKRAHMGALIECRWTKPETVIEVYNVNTGDMLGQYKRMLSSIVFMR